MTYIDESGGRTVNNSTVYDKRKVYEITADAVLDVGQSNGYGEVERTGERVTKRHTYHIIAVSEELARALYETKWGSPYHRRTFISMKPLFVIDGEISYGHD